MPSQVSELQNRCRRCGAPLDQNAVMCTQCGTYQKSGLNAKTVETAKGAGRVGLAMIVSAAAAVVAGVVWALIAIHAHVEIGYLAWGIGLLAGGAFFLILRDDRTAKTGAAAVGFALLGLLVGKLLTFSMMMPDVAKQIANDDDVMLGLILQQMSDNKEIAPDVMAVLNRDDAKAEELTPEMKKKVAEVVQTAQTRLAAMSKAERRARAQVLAGKAVSKISYTDRLTAVLSPWDILWCFLALGSAWKVGGAGGE